MSPIQTPFWDAVDRIRAERPAYGREAYGFVVAALGHTVRELPRDRRSDPMRRHLSGQELVRGVIGLARREFGFMAPAVFHEWGVHDARDIGEIVFHLVEAGQLSARPEDRREDFEGGPELRRALTEGLDLGAPGAGGSGPPASGPGAPGTLA